MESATERANPHHPLGWRVHLCTTTRDQEADEATAREWLQQHGCTVLARPSDPIELKIDAARRSDLCILLLGASFGPRDPLSSFSHTELEVSAAADIHPDKVLIFRHPEAATASSAEQREFVERVGSFQQGTFQRTYRTTNDLRSDLAEALQSWQPPQPRTAYAPRAVPSGAIMISSTGDLWQERARIRKVLEEQRLPIIDYLNEPSESVTPLDRVVTWARECRALVLILGARYGYVSPLDGLGITELEFVTALKAGHPIVALLGPKARSTSDKDQAQFVERVLTFLPGEYILDYDDATLEAQLQVGVGRLLQNVVPAQLVMVSEKDQLRWYHRQVQRWLGAVPHLLQPQGMPLEQIYVSLALAPLAPEAKPDEQHDEEAKVTTLDADEALKRFPRMVLEGEPGTGKTVALRWYAISTDSNAIPIYIRLGAYSQALERQAVSSLEDYIRQEERRLLLTSTNDQELWLPLLRAGRGVILLDGLDEVSLRRRGATSDSTMEAIESLRYRVTRDILALAQQLPATPIVVATRSVGGVAEQLAPTFTTLRIQPLNSTQQRQVVLQWLHTANPEYPLTSVQIAQRVLDVLNAQEQLRAWATTPLMLTLLTAIIDSVGDSVGSDSTIGTLSRAALLRRAIRLLLGQWGTLATRDEDDLLGKRRLGGKHLWPKEQLLVRLAWNTFLGGRRQFITEDDLGAAWQTLPELAQAMGDLSSVVSELSREDGFLPQLAEGQYVFYHPIFQEYLSAAMLASGADVSSDERLASVTHKRLNAGWEEATQLLVGELDRLGHPYGADDVILALTVADRRPLPGLAWSDPAHFALRRAARAQGSRTSREGGTKVVDLLAAAWSEVLLDGLTEPLAAGSGERRLLGVACQAFLDMGTAAVAAAPLLRRIVSEPITLTFSPPSGAIEALGNCGTPLDISLLASLLDREQGIGEPQAAALRGLLRLGPGTVRPYRDLLPRFVYAQRDIGADGTHSTGEYAAALLIHLTPTREELEGIGRLGGRWRQEALWAAPLLPLSDAIEMLHQAFNDGSGHIRGYYDARSRLDFRDDTTNDDRFAALAASSRLGLDMLPLLPDVLFRTTHDIPRNRRLAESIVLSLGASAVPVVRAYIEENWNEIARERFFGPVLVGLDTAHDPEQIRSLLGQTIAALREIAEIQEQRRQSDLDTQRAAGRTPIPREAIKSVSLDQLLVTLRSARGNGDLLIQEVLVAQSLDTIAHMGPSAAPALDDVRALAKVARYRRRAMAALAGLGVAAIPAFPELLQALSDHDEFVRACAVEAIGQLGEAARPALPMLRSILSSRGNAKAGQEVRRQAVVAWGRLWPLTRPFLPDILEIVRKDPDTYLRVSGVDILGQVADAEPQVLEALYALAETVGSHLHWETDLQSHARAALDRVLVRVEDADLLLA